MWTAPEVCVIKLGESPLPASAIPAKYKWVRLRAQAPFDQLDDMASIPEGVYLRPRSKNYPTIDSLVVLPDGHAVGLAPHKGTRTLVLFQVTVSDEHTVNGAKIKEIQDVVQAKLPAAAAASSSKAKKGGLHTVLVFVTTPSGVRKAQVIKNGEGNPYARKGDEPKVKQFSMYLGDAFEKLVLAWNNGNE
jgi:hypothetical protein